MIFLKKVYDTSLVLLMDKGLCTTNSITSYNVQGYTIFSGFGNSVNQKSCSGKTA